MDKIEELKKLLWILDSKHNVSIPQTKENIDYIADEIVKLFCQPAVTVGWVCNSCNSLEYTLSVSEDDIQQLGCVNCGGDEFHLGNGR